MDEPAELATSTPTAWCACYNAGATDRKTPPAWTPHIWSG